MSATMEKALFAIGQAMHGRRVDIRAIGDCGYQLSVYHVMVELIHAREGISVWVNSDHVETSNDANDVARAAIAHLVHSG